MKKPYILLTVFLAFPVLSQAKSKKRTIATSPIEVECRTVHSAFSDDNKNIRFAASNAEGSSTGYTYRSGSAYAQLFLEAYMNGRKVCINLEGEKEFVRLD